MKYWEAAVAVLKETNNPAVMWGDVQLLHMIAKRADKSYAHPLILEKQVLAALTKCPGILIPGHTKAYNNRIVRIFRLPETTPVEFAQPVGPKK